MKRCAVIVMAKAPLPGIAKTRLIPVLGAEGAARLAARMLAECVSQALEADIGQVELCCAPNAQDPAFTSWAQTPGLALTTQGEGDLGARMRRALERHLCSGARAMLIGTDIPALDAHYLRLADQALQQADAVFGPTADGGYCLVALHKPAPRLFDPMAWSTSAVMATTRERLSECGLRCAELPVLHDVDEPDDLVHLPAAWR